MTIAAAPSEPPRSAGPLRSPPPRARRSACAFAAVLAVMGLAAAGTTAAQRLQAHVSLASDYVVHGVSRSQGDPTLQAQLGLDLDAGWSAGLSAATLNLNPGPGPNRELGLYVARSTSLNRDWVLAAGLWTWLYSAQIPGLPYNYREAALELSWRERVQLGVAVSPDYSVGTRLGVARDSTTLDYTLTISQPVARPVALSAGLGYFDLSDGLGLGFWYWSASAVYTGERLSVALTWTDAEDVTQAMFNARATGERLIATVSLRLH